MIRRIGYVSRPVPGLALVEIARIVSVCRARNNAANVLGVLLFTGLDFAQVLEGPSDAVASVWRKICADARHRDLVTLFDEHASTMWFEDWRVGFPSDIATVNQIAQWRRRTPQEWDEKRRTEVRTLLASVDAI
jgi:hypothetical protein